MLFYFLSNLFERIPNKLENRNKLQKIEPTTTPYKSLYCSIKILSEKSQQKKTIPPKHVNSKTPMHITYQSQSMSIYFHRNLLPALMKINMICARKGVKLYVNRLVLHYFFVALHRIQANNERHFPAQGMNIKNSTYSSSMDTGGS